MIEKKYLFNNKVDNYVKVCIETDSSSGLTQIYESLFATLDPQINIDDLFVVDYKEKSLGLYEVIVDVEDMDFSEFED